MSLQTDRQKVFKFSTDSLYLLTSGSWGKRITPRSHMRMQRCRVAGSPVPLMSLKLTSVFVLSSSAVIIIIFSQSLGCRSRKCVKSAYAYVWTSPAQLTRASHLQCLWPYVWTGPRTSLYYVTNCFHTRSRPPSHPDDYYCKLAWHVKTAQCPFKAGNYQLHCDEIPSFVVIISHADVTALLECSYLSPSYCSIRSQGVG